MGEEIGSLIPGLPDDISLICLARVPRQYHHILNCVHRRWKSVVSSEEFLTYRRKHNLQETWIYAFCRDRDRRNQFFVMDPSRQPRRCWKVLQSIPLQCLRREGMCFETLGGRLYLLGGCDWNAGVTNEVYCYDPCRNVWEQAAPLPSPRCYLISTTLNNTLYATSEKEVNSLSTLSWDTYNTMSKTWTSCEVFLRFKSFLAKRCDPSCLREFLIPMLSANSPSGNTGLQILDRNWGSGWNLLSMLLATKPSKRIRCLDALRHPFLCGPRWCIGTSVDVIRWSLGSTIVRIAEEYIYRKDQEDRMAYFIELLEMLNLHPNQKNWLELIPGKWRLLYSTGRHIGLTLREAQPRILIDNAYLTFTETSELDELSLKFTSDVSFKVISSIQWPHDEGDPGWLCVNSKSTSLTSGQTVYVQGESKQFSLESIARKLSSRKWKSIGSKKKLPTNLPTVRFNTDDIKITVNLGISSSNEMAQRILREVRMQIPTEMFDISKLVCGTYIDSRLMILRGVNGSALLFTRSC